MMNTAVNQINMFEFFNTDVLATRQSVKVLDSVLRNSTTHKIQLDFSDITQISRSFADEFYKMEKNLISYKFDLDSINMSSSIKKMIDIVSDPLKSGSFTIDVSAVDVVDLNAL